MWRFGIAVVVALVIGAGVTYGLLALASEQDEANCLSEAELRYPSEVVASDNPFNEFGPPERVTNADERQEAADAC